MATSSNCGSNESVSNIIAAFPEELLLKIFDFLDMESLKNVTLVDTRWLDIVTSENVTMKKLPLTINGHHWRRNHMIGGKLNYNFYKVEINMIKSFGTKMLSNLKKIGSNMREIEFAYCMVKEPKVFKDILNNFPKAEKLTFNGCSFRKIYKESHDSVLELVKLDELVIKQSCLTVNYNNLTYY